MKQWILNRDERTYTSNMNAGAMKHRLESLFDEDPGGVAGRFVGDHGFAVHDKLIVIGWAGPGIRRRAAYLTGEIIEANHGVSVNVKTWPNYLMPTLALLAIVSGIAVVLITLQDSGYSEYLTYFGLVLVVLGLVYYPLSTFLRNRLRNTIVNYLELHEA